MSAGANGMRLRDAESMAPALRAAAAAEYGWRYGYDDTARLFTRRITPVVVLPRNIMRSVAHMRWMIRRCFTKRRLSDAATATSSATPFIRCRHGIFSVRYDTRS